MNNTRFALYMCILVSITLSVALVIDLTLTNHIKIDNTTTRTVPTTALTVPIGIPKINTITPKTIMPNIVKAVPTGVPKIKLIKDDNEVTLPWTTPPNSLRDDIKYTLTVVWQPDTTVFVELSTNTPVMTLSCDGYQSTNTSLTKTPHGVLFQFTNTNCRQGQTTHVAYVLSNGKQLNTTTLLREQGLTFKLNLTGD